MAQTYTTSSAQETIEVGKKIAANLKPGSVVLLYGNLGSGKTTFVKGIAIGLGITDDIVSPTFTLMNVYSPKLSTENCELSTVIHIDTYRLKNADEFVSIGAFDFIGQPGTITLIEWPDLILPLLIKFSPISISLRQEKNEQTRTITIDE